ncbi:hypothetical protein EAF00_005610 [Botryotinia globosa]|nr:hypothetical protein EAF00_005610 [Botryotinia globosa]
MLRTQCAISSSTKRISPYKTICSPFSRRSFTQKLVQANDVVLLKPETNPRAMPTLTKPLKQGNLVVFRDHRKVKAEDVIGKPYRSVVAGGRRALFRIYEPTLGQYCDSAPRMVTPIYSSDASLIVSLLDLNFRALPSSQYENAIESERLWPRTRRPLKEPVVSQDEDNLKPATSPSSENMETTDTLEKDNFEPAASPKSENMETTDTLEKDNFEPAASPKSENMETTDTLEKDNFEPAASPKSENMETTDTLEKDNFEPAASPKSENLETTDTLEKDNWLEETLEKDNWLEEIEGLPSEPTALTDAEMYETLDFVEQNDDTLQIFEAGTGAGSLTLHLARAIHGANTRAPPIPKLPKIRGKVDPDDDIYLMGGKAGNRNEELTDLYNEWRSQRRAVIHSLDSDERHSRHAQRTVRNYRHGVYFPHIDFHVGSIHDYLSKRLEETKDVFLDHAILDIPGIQDEMEIVGKCLKPDGCLITWCPSITQHMKCLEIVKGKKLPFVLDRVLELGSQLSTGGREWEVRSVKPRALITAEKKAKAEEMEREDRSKRPPSAVEEWFTKISSKEVHEVATEDVETSESESVTVQASTGEASDPTDVSGWEMICRPRVGDRITGGGFVGVWKKMDMDV